MSRIPLPFHSTDISALARSLNGQLAGLERKPGHVEMLNMLARSVGFRNFQHFRAERGGADEPADREPAVVPVPAPAPVDPPIDLDRLRRIVRLFDDKGRLTRWPPKLSHRELCLWVLWSRIQPRTVFSESEINQLLTAEHLFGDYALLRRWLCDLGMMVRTTDGREYRRVERRPPADTLALARLIDQAKV